MTRNDLPNLSGLTADVATQVRQLAEVTLPELQELCRPWLELPEPFGNGQRIRVYPPKRTFFMFLNQVLDPAGSCAKAVVNLWAFLADQGQPTPSPNTAAYCRARDLLREEDLRAIHAQLNQRILQGRGEPDLLCGRIVKVADGTTVSLADTLANQTDFPQPTSQTQGCGFPIMRLVTVFDLATGIMLDMARGAAYGPQAVGERTLYHSLWPTFQPGEVILGDRGFCSWADVSGLKQRGVDSVVRRLHRVACEVVEVLGPDDRLVRWKKPRKCPDWMDPTEWADLPAFQLVREVTFTVTVRGFRTRTVTLVTTLLDPQAFPAQALAELYRKRWLCELWLRDIKTAMKMDVLACRTPAMVHKELWMHIIAHNLVRALMATAARTHNVPITRISFTRTLVALQEFAPRLATQDEQHRHRLWQALLRLIATCPLPDRPNRTAARAIKRRPKPFPLLNKPRDQFQDIPHRSRYKAATTAQRSQSTMTCALS